jgi:WD40 repeat protein
MTVVIDALDECDLEEDVKRIIGLLARTQSLPGFKLKFFLTSRPEYHIRLGFDKLEVRSHKDVALHTIPEPVVEHDLSVYLVHQLTHIRDEYNRMAPEEFHLPRDWPPTSEIQKLVNMAVPLFIFAATVCRLLEDMAPSNPADELTKILMRPAGTSDEKLTATYAPVLDRLVTGKHGSRMSSRQRADIVSRFKNIIGSLILLAEPLSIISLANLLGVSRSTVDGIVNSLHSVLRVPRDLSSPVKTFHLSFREFLVDRDGDVPEDIWIDEEKTNEELGIKCLELLSRDSHLQYDMCDLGELAKRRSTIPQEKLDSSLSPEVQYACLYWIHHLKEGNAILRDGEQAHEFLKKHFLHWLEALSLMGRLAESTRLTQELQTLVDPNEGTKIMEFLHDAQRFILRFRAIGDQAPLQFYSSALLFAPENSVIKKTFQNYVTWIRQKPTMEDDWNPCLQTLEGHDGIVDAVAFSRDGRSIASGSHDNTVNLWDTTTGELRHTLRGHENTVKCVALSGDGQLVASGSYDCTVKVWNVATGDVEHTFQGHKNKVQSVAFSINDRSVVSGSDDSTVKIWDLATGTLRLSLEAHNDAVESVACANNGRLIASGSRDKKINLWDASTGELQRNLEGHSGIVRGVVFSPDSALLASRSKDKSIRIWNVKSGALQLRIKGNSGPSLAFSSDGKFIASEKNNTVVIRDVVSGEIYQTLQGHSREVTCVAYSASGGLLASASFDNTVKIWDTKSRSSEQSPEGHSSEVLSLAISPDSRLLTSGSGDNSVKVWDAASGKLKHSLEDHTARIKAVSFSPNSSLIASASEDDSIKLWDAETGNLQQSLNRRLRMAQVLAFSPDSQLLATSVDASELAVWNIDDGDGTHFQLSDNAGASAQQLAFSPDSTLVAAADWGHTNVWDVGKRRRLYTFKGPSGRPLWMGFSPNSKVLGLRFESKPNRIKIWDMLSGLSRQAHQEHGLTTFKTVFSADSKTLEITSWNTDQELLVREELDCEVGTPDSTSPDGSSTMLTSRVETSKPRSYRLDAQKTWIQRDGQNLLWIPPDYRLTAYSMVLQLRNWAADDSENRVAIGSASGRVLIIAFDS